MCPPIILAKLLAQFDPERKFPSPPNILLLGNQPKPTPQVQWAHRPRTKARGVILQSQHPEAWVTLLLALVLLLHGGVWGLFLQTSPSPSSTIPLPIKLLTLWSPQGCSTAWQSFAGTRSGATFPSSHVSPWLCHSSLPQKAGAFAACKAPKLPLSTRKPPA